MRAPSSGPSTSALTHTTEGRPRNPLPTACRLQSSHADAWYRPHTRGPYSFANLCCSKSTTCAPIFPHRCKASPCEPHAHHFFKTGRPNSLLAQRTKTPGALNIRADKESCSIVGDLGGFHNAPLGSVSYRYGNLLGLKRVTASCLLPHHP